MHNPVATFIFFSFFFLAHRKPKGHWKNVENRRAFFLDFARENAFDANDAHNWADVKGKLIASKVNKTLVAHTAAAFTRL